MINNTLKTLFLSTIVFISSFLSSYATRIETESIIISNNFTVSGTSTFYTITFGNVTRTNWPDGGSPTNWSLFPAISPVEMSAYDFNRVWDIRLMDKLLVPVNTNAKYAWGGWTAEQGVPYYVATNGNDNNNGLSWSAPFLTISNAIPIAGSGNTIYVSNGTYNISEQLNVTNDVLIQSFSKNAEDTIINAGENSRVVYLVGTNTGAIFEGFTVRGGYIETTTYIGGAGLYVCNFSQAHNCIMRANQILENSGGFAYGGGAGAFIEKGGIISHSKFINNRIYSGQNLGGAGISVTSGKVYNCLFVGNTNEISAGSAIYMNHANAEANNILAYYNENGVGTAGGAVFVLLGTLSGATITRNYNDGINQNSAGNIYNSIFWGDYSASGLDLSNVGSTADYCNVESQTGTGTWGTNNISSDPLFIGADNEDFMLFPNSPSVDSGNNTNYAYNDLSETARIKNAILDMGAYETGKDSSGSNAVVWTGVRLFLTNQNMNVGGWGISNVGFISAKTGTFTAIILNGVELTNWPDLISSSFTNTAGIWGNGVGLTNMPLNSGFIDETTSTMSFTNADRTFAISPTGTSFRVVNHGKWVVITNMLTSIIPDTNGLYYIYFGTDDNLTNSTTSWPIAGEAQVAMVYWDSSNDVSLLFGDERHANSMSDDTHKYLHETRGTLWGSGLTLSRNAIVSGTPSANGSNTVISLTGGTLYDEDHIITISTNIQKLGASPIVNTNSAAYIPIWYATGTVNNAYWRSPTPTQFPFPYSGGVPLYNQLTGGLWTLTPVANSAFFVEWVFGNNGETNAVIIIPHHTTYNTLALAQNGATPETIFQNRSEALPVVEMKLLYRLVFEYRTGYSANINGSGLRDVVDYRVDNTRPLNNAPTTSHGSLTGLGNDDHTQYVLGDGTRSMNALTVDGSVAIANGIQTNGATWQCTNTVTGQGRWFYPPFCKVWLNGTMVVTNLGTPKIAWAGEVSDKFNMHSTSVTNTHILIKEPGIYSVKVYILWLSTTASSIYTISIHKNNTIVGYQNLYLPAGVSISQSQGVFVDEPASENDSFSVQVIQQSGGEITIYNDQNYSWFSVLWSAPKD